MSVQQIKQEIAKLAPAEVRQLAAWLNDFVTSTKSSARPKVGEITSGPVITSEDCFAPLSEEEMQQWGFA